MPIRFRCTYCNRLLGIATRKAGTETTCPHCGLSVTVPAHDDSKTEHVNLEDVEQLLGGVATERVTEPVTQIAEPGTAPARPSDPAKASVPKRPAPPPVPKRVAPPPVPKAPRPDPDDPPLFERDVDAILGSVAAPEEPDRPRPPPASGLDAMSLGDPPRTIVLSAQSATLLMGGVVALMAVSFAAGYFLAKW